MRSVKRFSVATWSTIPFLLLLGTLFASTANAQLADQITLPNAICGGDLTTYGNCTAGEISIAEITNTLWDNPWEDDQTCVRGETITSLTSTVSYRINTQKRYDLLMWIGEQEGTDPRDVVAGDTTKSCIVMSMPGPFPGGTGDNVFIDLEADQCGDINGAGADANIPEVREFHNVSFNCQDNNNNGKADIQLLLTWSQNTNQSCGLGNGETFPTNGANSKCDYQILDSTLDVVEPASLTVVKETLGGDESFRFDFAQTSGTGLPANTTVTTTNGTGQQVFSTLSAHPDLDIIEVLPAGWDTTAIVCTGATNNGSFVDDTSLPSITGIEIAAGEDVVCTVSNTKLATLVVVKNTTGDVGEFDFAVNNGIGRFSLDTTTPTPGTAFTTFSNLQPGLNYEILEDVPDGWNLSTVSCSNGSGEWSLTGVPGLEMFSHPI